MRILTSKQVMRETHVPESKQEVEVCTPTPINTHRSTHARFYSSLAATVSQAESLNGDNSETANKCTSQDNDWTPVTILKRQQKLKSNFPPPPYFRMPFHLLLQAISSA